MTTALNGLFCEIRWGPELAEARSFNADQQTIRMAPDESADLPAYGFELPDDGQLLAERTSDGRYRIHPPPGTELFREARGQPRKPVPPEELQGPPDQRTFVLTAGDAISVVVASKDLRLYIAPSVVDRPVGRGSLQRLGSAVLLIGAALLLPFLFVTGESDPQELRELQERARIQDQERRAERRRAIEAAYPSTTDADAEPVRPEDGLTLPGNY
ncbi:MAG TPA: hypothetical protein VK013_07600, partial [Myxococcaceae bacterium]|nr:hypothetical protein [Myxococcaceae bacterium]